MLAPRPKRRQEIKVIICAPPIWGQPVEAPEKRTASGLDYGHRGGAPCFGAHAATACCQAQMLEFVRVEDRGRRGARGAAGIYRDCPGSRGGPCHFIFKAFSVINHS